VEENKLVTGMNAFKIDLNQKSAGSYLMKITTDNGVLYEKFELLK